MYLMNLDSQEKLWTSLMLDGNKDSGRGQDSENNTMRVRVTIGQRQRGALSPVLFNLVLEKVVWDLNVPKEQTLILTIRLLAYVDDIVLLKKCRRDEDKVIGEKTYEYRSYNGINYLMEIKGNT